MGKIKMSLQHLARFVKMYWLRILGILFVFVSLSLLIWAGYSIRPDVSGFGSYEDADGKLQRGKTFWDWMELLIIPAALAGGALFFNKTEKENEMKIAKQRKENEMKIAEQRNKTEQSIAVDRQQEAALQAYIDKMTELLLSKDTPLRASNEEDDEVRVVARTRTLTTLNSIDPPRKTILLQFLFEANLMNTEKRIFELAGANLSGVNLSMADLTGAKLTGADLTGAEMNGAILINSDLIMAKLSQADLWGTDLTGAKLNRAILINSDLSRADLIGANLRGANLTEADLIMANLTGANLIGANLSHANLSGAKLNGADLRGANLSHANLSYADLSMTDLNLATLNDADLSHADLSGANLSGTNLSGTDLSGANLSGTNLREVMVTSEQLAKANSLEGAKMPDGPVYDPAIHKLPKVETK